MYYSIDPALPNQARVRDAIEHWETATCFRFVESTDETDFVTFRPGDGCRSSVGRKGGEQYVTLSPGCSTGNTIHEIGHAVGLWHEQMRADRDIHLLVYWDNIQKGKGHNFKTYVEQGKDGLDQITRRQAVDAAAQEVNA